MHNVETISTNVMLYDENKKKLTDNFLSIYRDREFGKIKILCSIKTL